MITRAQTRIKITVENDEGQAVEMLVAVRNANTTAWELHAAKKGWPSQSVAPILALTWQAWHALRRAGDTDQMFDAFNDSVIDICVADADGNPLSARDGQLVAAEDGIEADPTQADHASAY